MEPCVIVLVQTVTVVFAMYRPVYVAAIQVSRVQTVNYVSSIYKVNREKVT